MLTAYSEKKWLKLLKTFNPYRRYDLYDAIWLFYDMKNSNYSLPNKPLSINYLHNHLLVEFQTQNREYYSELENITPKNHLCSSCINYHGKTYHGNVLICAIHPYGQENCTDFELD